MASEKELQNSMITIASEYFRFQRVFEKVLSRLRIEEQEKYRGQFSWFSKRIDASVLEKLHDEVASVFYSEGYDAYKAKSVQCYKEAVHTDFVTSDVVTVLVIAPDGTRYAFVAFGDPSVKFGNYNDFTSGLADAFAFRRLSIEKGQYSLKLYDEKERCLIGTWHFNVR